MDLTFLRGGGIFIQIQYNLHHVQGQWVTQIGGIHAPLYGFIWMMEEVAAHPTRTPDLILLAQTIKVNHNDLYNMCVGL